MPWQPATQSSADRYSRLIHTGATACAAIASSCTSGSSQAKASITISPGADATNARVQWRNSTPSTMPPTAGSIPLAAGQIRVSTAQSSTQSLTAASSRRARSLASRQQTPISPKLSTTSQKISHFGRGAGTESIIVVNNPGQKGGTTCEQGRQRRKASKRWTNRAQPTKRVINLFFDG
jgi:hypothetical protein